MEVLLGLFIVIAVLLFIAHRRAPHRGDMTPEEAQRNWGKWGSSGGGM